MLCIECACHAGSVVACKREGSEPGLLVIEPPQVAAAAGEGGGGGGEGGAGRGQHGWRLHFLAQRDPPQLLSSFLKVRVYACASLLCLLFSLPHGLHHSKECKKPTAGAIQKRLQVLNGKASLRARSLNRDTARLKCMLQGSCEPQAVRLSSSIELCLS
eukprot:1141402-Pelagomonas_calceolata.AAC.7